MSKISKTKEYAILYLTDVMKVSPEFISKELKIAVSTINEILNSRTSKKHSSKKKTTKAHDMMIRHTSAKKNNSVSIMTKEANEYQEELIKNIPAPQKENTAIFKMR